MISHDKMIEPSRTEVNTSIANLLTTSVTTTLFQSFFLIKKILNIKCRTSIKTIIQV